MIAMVEARRIAINRVRGSPEDEVDELGDADDAHVRGTACKPNYCEDRGSGNCRESHSV